MSFLERRTLSVRVDVTSIDNLLFGISVTNMQPGLWVVQIGGLVRSSTAVQYRK